MTINIQNWFAKPTNGSWRWGEKEPKLSNVFEMSGNLPELRMASSEKLYRDMEDISSFLETGVSDESCLDSSEKSWLSNSVGISKSRSRSDGLSSQMSCKDNNICQKNSSKSLILKLLYLVIVQEF